MKKILIFAFSCLVAVAAHALPAQPGIITVTQSDGTVLTLRMVGDEHFHYFVDVNSGQQMLRTDNGDFYAAQPAQLAALKTAAIDRRNKTNAKRLERLTEYQRRSGVITDVAELATSAPKKTPGHFNGSLTGQRKGLVILVNFTDLEHSSEDPQAEWNAAFNEVGYNKNGHIGSVHDYFYDQSYGQFDLEFDVVGPVTVSRAMKYYGQNNSYGSDAHPAQMVAEACQMVDSSVDFKDYDWDGDGEVDQVYVIYAGYGEASGAPAETIWPHEYWLEYGYGQKLHLDGTYINTYACSSELRGASGKILNGIGAACHEFSHCIGYPDFYDTDYSGAFGMNAFDILDNGSYNGPDGTGTVPAGYTAYERWMAGWLEPVVLKEGCEVEGMRNIGEYPDAYVIYNETKKIGVREVDEYYLLENRKADRWFTYPGAHGMLALHVDYSSSAWAQNTVNDVATHQRMTIIPAGQSYGTYQESYKSWFCSLNDYRSMLFPGSKKIMELTDEMHYNSGGKLFNRNTDGTYKMGKPITEIIEDTNENTISFIFMGGHDDGNRWHLTFNAGDGKTTIQDWQQTKNSETLILPEATSSYPGWRFFGWTTSYVAPSKERPEILIAPGTKYKPTADVDFYAVYGYNPDGELLDEFHYVTNLRSGQEYVFLSKGAATTADVYAISAEKLLDETYQRTPEGVKVTVDFEAAQPTIVNPPSSMIWRAEGTEDLLSLINGEKYLMISNGGMGLTVMPTTLGWNTDYGLYGTTSGGAKYFTHTSTAKFSFSTTRTKSSRVFAYEKCDFSDREVTYATSLPEGISQITAGSNSLSTSIFDLQGRKVTPAAHGVFIQNGRKEIR